MQGTILTACFYSSSTFKDDHIVYKVNVV